jgi:hypothetical protein
MALLTILVAMTAMMLLTLPTVFVLRLPMVAMIVKTVQTVLLKMIKAAQMINSQMILILTMMMLGLHLPDIKIQRVC